MDRAAGGIRRGRTERRDPDPADESGSRGGGSPAPAEDLPIRQMGGPATGLGGGGGGDGGRRPRDGGGREEAARLREKNERADFWVVCYCVLAQHDWAVGSWIQ